MSPPSPWTPGARYNLARCYEQLGQSSLARQWLESDKESPQRHGNLLRATDSGEAVELIDELPLGPRWKQRLTSPLF